MLPLRPSGGSEEHQHPVVDAAAVGPSPDVFRNSDSESCICHHRGTFSVQKSGVPGLFGSYCMEVSVFKMLPEGGVRVQLKLNSF